MEFDDLDISNLKILLCSNRIVGGTIQSRNSVKENERSKQERVKVVEMLVPEPFPLSR